jgi:cytochrome c
MSSVSSEIESARGRNGVETRARETGDTIFQHLHEILPMRTSAVRTRDIPARAALVLVLGALAWTHALRAHAAPDVAAGKADFVACSACHSVNGSDGVGPHLNGVIGRKAGTVAGFSYSGAVKQSNIVWDANSLDAYIADPQKAIPGNHMPYSGLPDATARADIVAYLGTLK